MYDVCWIGICMESLCNSRTVCPIDNIITCLRTLHSLLYLPYPRQLLTANAKLPVEVCNVMHRWVMLGLRRWFILLTSGFIIRWRWGYGDARVPNWLHRHRTPCPRSLHRTCVGAREERFEAGNLSALISPLCDYTLPFGSIIAMLLVTIWSRWEIVEKLELKPIKPHWV